MRQADLTVVGEKMMALYIDLLQMIHRSSIDHFKHADSMLTWLIGLMGAALFYANNTLAGATARR